MADRRRCGGGDNNKKAILNVRYDRDSSLVVQIQASAVVTGH